MPYSDGLADMGAIVCPYDRGGHVLGEQKPKNSSYYNKNNKVVVSIKMYAGSALDVPIR